MKFALLITLLLAPLVSLHSADVLAQKPNILLIVADDLGYGDVSAYGCKDFNTPHLDSIAKAGMRFTSGYVTAPVFGPSRAALMTGRHNCRILPFEGNPSHGSDTGLPLEHKTMADHLKTAGYRTAALGKWHLGETPQHHPMSRGFDEFFGFLSGMHSYFKAEDAAWGPLLRGREKTELKDYLTFALADEACAIIRRPSPAPFFLYLAFNAPHVPLEAPENYLAKTAHLADRKRRLNAAMILAMDDAVGRVLAALRESGRADNTLIVFLSDNGAALIKGSAENGGSNAPLRGSKAQLWEGGIRVPFFVQWPGHIAAGGVSDTPVSSLDLLPTLLAAANSSHHASRDESLDGLNLLPWLEGKAEPPTREHFFWKFGANQFAIRGGDMKLVRVGADKGLFNVRQDISETTDRTEARAILARQLEAAWKKWDAGNLVTTRTPRAKQAH
ncbi:MAG: sulfatase-like hydrolase/transferase [Verrucomicrobia bacterium]|nr:sulfatase-like hydrolase/transferase [Verrucomicrobiota bacterium]